jgi:hypothetical protein
MTPPSWPELIILMCFGETEEMPFTGVVEVDEALVGAGAELPRPVGAADVEDRAVEVLDPVARPVLVDTDRGRK